jgi:cysteinyl-tRNA synthetase
VITQAEKALERLRTALRPAPASNVGATQIEQALQQQVEATRQGFAECMDDDINTAGALGHMFDLARAINQSKDAGLDVTPAQALLRELMEVFGLQPERTPVEGGEAAPFVELLVMIRKELRQQKLWALSDLVRDRLVALGVVMEDSKEGTTWRWK